MSKAIEAVRSKGTKYGTPETYNTKRGGRHLEDELANYCLAIESSFSFLQEMICEIWLEHWKRETMLIIFSKTEGNTRYVLRL